nr:MAG TPA: hypothetical protein [Inoviridae sp.]
MITNYKKYIELYTLKSKLKPPKNLNKSVKKKDNRIS